MNYSTANAQKGMAEPNITQSDVKLPQPEEDKREAYRTCGTLLVSKTHVQFLKGRKNTQRPMYRRSKFEQNMLAGLTNGKLNKTRFNIFSIEIPLHQILGCKKRQSFKAA